MQVKNILVSTYKKDGLVQFIKELLKIHDATILSTGGTARLLRSDGINVKDVSDFTGAPELFNGRIKTLHPRIEGGILFRRSNANDVKEAEENDIESIDMVVCNLYPFEEAISDPNISLDDALEMIDIGGPTMIRAAAKNFKDVIVVSRPDQYENILKELKEKGGEISLETRMT
ncbi:MAG: bifunctional phosphoribosylaminoimidazolecarboxamide formyltransferase/IMP cyclohydrolase, partial [Candidatus Hodarchaeota archaeon]